MDCSECKKSNIKINWCQNCNGKRFQQDFDKWTSGNNFIDKFIQETQMKAKTCREFMEWIPYNRLRNIEYLTKGGFSTIYKAIWLDGYIIGWDNKLKTLNRFSDYLKEDDYNDAEGKDIESPLNDDENMGFRVVLKSLDNSSNINDDFLNEWRNHLQCINSAANNKSYSVVHVYGITQDPETSNYMIVMDSIGGGNLRSNLLMKKFNPFEKYKDLMDIAKALLTLHTCNLTHGNFHSGNILLHSSLNFIYIIDYGLSRLVNKSNNSKEIYGVIPYMAPEILRGNPYTKAADIYSFGIIMWEFTSGVPAFNSVSHDFNLSLSICKGLRPKIIEGTLPVYARLMKRCWDSDPNNRPTTEELVEIFSFWRDYYPFNLDNERVYISSSEPITHPLSCYMSRKIDYSDKLNMILDHEELSAKCVMDENKKCNHNNKDYR